MQLGVSKAYNQFFNISKYFEENYNQLSIQENLAKNSVGI